MRDEEPAVPLWLDIGLLLVWCGVIGVSLVSALALANVFMGMMIMAGGGAVLFGLRTMVKKYRSEWA